MPITYQGDESPQPGVSLSGFRPVEPPFAVKPSATAPTYDRALHMQAVDVVASFVESGMSCMCKEFDCPDCRRDGHAAARTAAAVLARVAPDGVSVSRRRLVVYLIRR